MLLFVFTSVPLLFLSGISWPGAAMPEFWRYFSYIFPSTFGINGYVRINSMGATLNEVAFEYQAYGYKCPNLLPHHLPRSIEKERLAISVITNP